MRKWQFGNVITPWTSTLAVTLCDCNGQASRMLRPEFITNASNAYISATGQHLYFED